MFQSQGRSKSRLKAGLFLFWVSATAAAGDAIPSPYSQALNQMLQGSFEESSTASVQPQPQVQVQLECYELPGNRFYVGVKQTMTINATLSEVRTVVEDFPHYSQIFEGLVRSEIREREGSRFLVYLEQEIPVPFVANEKTEMLYSVDESKSQRVVFRYQLKKSNHLKYNDGAVILDRQGAGVRYTEYDFWDADWGFLAALGAGRIWKDSIRGLIQSDLAVKFRAEHPDWKPEKVLEESKQAADKSSFEGCLGAKKTFSGISVKSSIEPASTPVPSP